MAINGADIGSTLATKAGPLPVWGWVLLGSGGLAWYIHKRQANSGGASTNSSGVAGVVDSSHLAYPMPYSSDFNVTVTQPTVPNPNPVSVSPIPRPGPRGHIPAPVPHKLLTPHPHPKTKSLTYKVKPGNTLYGIAQQEYGNGNDYTRILAANRSTINSYAAQHGMPGNGSYIYPGESLVIPK